MDERNGSASPRPGPIPRARPFRALVYAAIGKDQESMRTRGLELFGLPEVVTPLGAPGPDVLRAIRN